MAKLEEIRERMHNRKVRWEQKLNALEAQLEATTEQAMKRVQDTALALVEAAEALEEKLEPAAKELKQSLEELRVQTALGKAETRDAFQAESRRVRQQLHAAEEKLDQLGEELEGRAGKEMEHFVNAGDHLRAELEAAELQFALGRAEARDAMAEGRAELRGKLAEAREDLKQASHLAGERWHAFEERMADALADAREAFRALGGR
jgi:ElaB/YqjD/DUF883 family membrane-anchored ribosome-binding protein